MTCTKYTDEASRSFILGVQEEIAEREILTDPELLSEAIGDCVDGDLYPQLMQALVDTTDPDINRVLECIAKSYAPDYIKHSNGE